MFIEQPPLILRWLYPRAFWRMDKNEKAVYLTFDDGPNKGTENLLKIVEKHKIPITSFVVGKHIFGSKKQLQGSKNYKMILW